jgi:hypothetical protein
MKRFGRGFAATIRAFDWLDTAFIVYVIGAGVVAGMVIEVLMDEFKP